MKSYPAKFKLRAALSLSCHTSNTVCEESTTYFLGYTCNLQCNTRIVHSLWMPHFSENNAVISYFVPFHAAHKTWNKLIICLQTPKSFDHCHRSLSQALEMIARNSWIWPVANSLDRTLCLELKWDRYQCKKSFHSNVSLCGDQGCSHNRSGNLPLSWKKWNTNMATQISREICDVMWKCSIHLSLLVMTSAVLILAVCSPWVLVARWIECPPGVQEFMGSIRVGDSDFFFFPHLSHVDQFTFTFYDVKTRGKNLHASDNHNQQ